MLSDLVRAIGSSTNRIYTVEEQFLAIFRQDRENDALLSLMC